MKRLRFQYGPKIRFFHCGEYGTLLNCFYYHVCLFNFDFYDKELLSICQGVRLYISSSFQKLWPFGFSTIGQVTFESAAYVARYIMKKINGKQSFEHYAIWDDDGTYLCQREKEYITMSRRPGIAREWFDKYCNTDVYPQDYIVISDKLKVKPPRYYDKLYDLTNSVTLSKIKYIRCKNAKLNPDNSPARLKIKEECKKLKLEKLVRTID
jgi:hypothetical protein